MLSTMRTDLSNPPNFSRRWELQSHFPTVDPHPGSLDHGVRLTWLMLPLLAWGVTLQVWRISREPGRVGLDCPASIAAGLKLLAGISAPRTTYKTSTASIDIDNPQPQQPWRTNSPLSRMT
jgi:hypothetical protein